VTAARHFDHRIHALFREVIMLKDQPIGQVVDYFRRIEAQARGSLHAHCLLWVKDAPKIGVNEDDEVIEFVDKYCTVHLPADNDNLFHLVSRQRHLHTKTCEKKLEGGCRFNFPRKAQEKTTIQKGIKSVRLRFAADKGNDGNEVAPELLQFLKEIWETRQKEQESDILGHNCRNNDVGTNSQESGRSTSKKKQAIVERLKYTYIGRRKKCT